MLSNHECEELFEGLAALLVDFRLEWVVDQVQNQIRIGKVIEREIETLKEAKLEQLPLGIRDTYGYAKGPKATFPVTIPYTPSEKLTLLISAIEHVVINTALMEKALAENLSTSRGWEGIEFRSEEEANRVNRIGEIDILRADHIKRLAEMLEKLKSEIQP